MTRGGGRRTLRYQMRVRSRSACCSGFVATRVDLNLTEILHGLAPELVKPFGQTLREFPIPNQQRRKSALLDEWMVERKHDGVVVDDVKRVTQLSRVPD